MIEVSRRGWCPGALAPMLSGDGYIFRLRLTNGALSFERARDFVGLARRFGNGAFDLSARGNLNLRGVPEARIADVQAELAALGLLDADAKAEAVRNVVPSPLAGFDPSAPLDARPLVAALEALLTREKIFQNLPPKFGFSIDGGGALPLDGVATDIDFTALPGDAPRLAVALGGVVAGTLAPADLGAAVEGLVRNFLELRGEDRRMSALVARVGVTPMVENLSCIDPADDARALSLLPARGEKARMRGGGGRAASGPDYAKILGAHPCGAQSFVGAGLLFGRIDADALEALSREAEAFGAKELRLTAWRAILAVGLSAENAAQLSARLAPLGFLLDANDPRLAFAACAGAPACPSARADVRSVALALAPHWRADAGRVHVSACVKGCALHAMALTIVAGDDGFSLVEYGLARDEASAQGLDLAALQQRFDRLTGAQA